MSIYNSKLKLINYWVPLRLKLNWDRDAKQLRLVFALPATHYQSLSFSCSIENTVRSWTVFVMQNDSIKRFTYKSNLSWCFMYISIFSLSVVLLWSLHLFSYHNIFFFFSKESSNLNKTIIIPPTSCLLWNDTALK